MNLFLLVWRNLWKKPLSSFLTLLLFALGTAIILSISNAQESLKNRVKESVQGVDMVLGANGSPLQLVLSSLFHIDFPTGNIPLEETKKILRDPLIKEYLFLSIGDNFKGYRIIGTEGSFCGWFDCGTIEGRMWENDLEVVIGAEIAKLENLRIGDEIHSSHGFSEEGMTHDHSHFEIVGILEKSGGPEDKLLFCSTETIWEVHGDENPTDPEITSCLIRFRNPGGLIAFPRKIRNNPRYAVASPAFELNRLFLVFAPLISFLEILAWVIMLISGLSIMFALFNTLSDRIYEISLMRVMGASRVTVFVSLCLEGVYLSVAGFVVGDIFSRVLNQGLVSWLLPGFSSQGNIFSFTSFEMSLFVFVILMGILASVIPALIGARKDISRVLFSE